MQNKYGILKFHTMKNPTINKKKRKECYNKKISENRQKGESNRIARNDWLEGANGILEKCIPIYTEVKAEAKEKY